MDRLSLGLSWLGFWVITFNNFMFEQFQLGIVEAAHDEWTKNFFSQKIIQSLLQRFDASSVSFFSNQVWEELDMNIFINHRMEHSCHSMDSFLQLACIASASHCWREKLSYLDENWQIKCFEFRIHKSSRKSIKRQFKRVSWEFNDRPPFQERVLFGMKSASWRRSIKYSCH